MYKYSVINQFNPTQTPFIALSYQEALNELCHNVDDDVKLLQRSGVTDFSKIIEDYVLNEIYCTGRHEYIIQKYQLDKSYLDNMITIKFDQTEESTPIQNINNIVKKNEPELIQPDLCIVQNENNIQKNKANLEKVKSPDDELELENMDEDDIKMIIKKLEEEKENKEDFIEEHEPDIIKFADEYYDAQATAKREKKEKEKRDAKIVLFKVDKETYKKIKKDVENKVIQEQDVSILFKKKYEILKEMEQNHQLDVENDFEIFCSKMPEEEKVDEDEIINNLH